MSARYREELSDNDFKYVIMDVESICLGARFTFGELLREEMVPFKLKAILNQYVLKEADPDTTLESQFYYMTPEGFLYDTFSQLKVRVKVLVRTKKSTLFGKKRWVYVEKALRLRELAETNPAEKEARGMIVREIIISKLGLLTFSV